MTAQHEHLLAANERYAAAFTKGDLPGPPHGHLPRRAIAAGLEPREMRLATFDRQRRPGCSRAVPLHGSQACPAGIP